MDQPTPSRQLMDSRCRMGLHATAAGSYRTSRKVLKVHCKLHGWAWSKKDLAHWSEVKLPTFFTVPEAAVHYFCVRALGAGAGAGAEEETDKQAKTKCQLLEDITEQWALQRVLAEGVPKHETTNWLKRTQWITHFRGKDLIGLHKCSRMPG